MNYLTRLIDALLARPPAAVPVEPALAAEPPAQPPPPAADATLAARVAALEMDLRERDQRIDAMRQEYASLETAAQRAAAGAGAGQMEQLFKKLAAPLSNLAALSALAAEGREVAAADLLHLIGTLDKHLKAAGLETLGVVGSAVPFDVAVHQRMSGGMVSASTPVLIRTPGYRFAGKVLLKAMVTAKEPAA